MSSQPRVRAAMERMAVMNPKYGTVSFDVPSYKSLNPYIARSTLSIWLRYVGATTSSINRYGLQKLHNLIVQERNTSDTNSHCILIPLPKEEKFIVARQKPMSGKAGRVPIRVGETILWDSRFRITLFEKTTPSEREGTEREEEGVSKRGNVDSRTFYVRNFLVSDHMYMTRGVRKVKGTVLVHPHVRGGLPVVEDEGGRVVLIPHFRVVNHRLGVDCKVTFAPQWSMQELLYFHYISNDSAHPG